MALTPGTRLGSYQIAPSSASRFAPTNRGVWSPTRFVFLGTASPYDVHPDGRRLAIIAAQEQTNVIRDQIVLISNFFDYLWKIAPGRK